MSRYENRRETRGHGVLGFFLTLIIVIGLMATVVLFFTGDKMNGVKAKVYGIFYPQKYTEQVERSSAEFGVDADLIYAVIRTESGFRAEVESHAGAMGLMQLMPSTFEWLQERLDGEVSHDTAALTDPDINVRYGAYFLSILIERYDGNLRTIAAAYNAGTSTVDGWLGDPAYSSDGKTLTRIPYEETANYADRVEKAYQIYRELYHK